jgi:tryptophan-rich sensory protein
MNNHEERYKSLKKPSWAPPKEVFAPMWTLLYFLMFLSFGYVFVQTITGNNSWEIFLPFALNLFFNILYTPIEFKLKNNLLALIDVLLILVTLIWAFFIVWGIYPNVVYINIFYLIWVLFAFVLQLNIYLLNK